MRPLHGARLGEKRRKSLLLPPPLHSVAQLLVTNRSAYESKMSTPPAIALAVVPPGCAAGQMIMVQTPDGQTMQVPIPAGAVAGQQFQFVYMAAQTAVGLTPAAPTALTPAVGLSPAVAAAVAAPAPVVAAAVATPPEMQSLAPAASAATPPPPGLAPVAVQKDPDAAAAAVSTREDVPYAPAPCLCCTEKEPGQPKGQERAKYGAEPCGQCFGTTGKPTTPEEQAESNAVNAWNLGHQHYHLRKGANRFASFGRHLAWHHE